jgi:hypothetical protein
MMISVGKARKICVILSCFLLALLLILVYFRPFVDEIVATCGRYRYLPPLSHIIGRPAAATSPSRGLPRSQFIGEMNPVIRIVQSMLNQYNLD